MRFLKALVLSSVVLLITHSAGAQDAESFAFTPADFLKTVKIFPNPAVDYVSLKFEAPVAKQVTLEVHSIIGNSIEVEREVVDEYEVRLKVKDLPSGYYLLDIKSGTHQRGSYKFVKR